MEYKLKPIPGFSKYLAEIETGRIFKKGWNLYNQYGKCGYHNGFFINGCKDSGYIYGTFISDNNKKIYTSFHRLIMMSKIQTEIPKGYVVDHINNKRDDNRIENLRLSSYSDNTKNSSKTYVLKNKIFLQYSENEYKNEIFISLDKLGYPFNLEQNLRYISNLGRIKFYNRKTKNWEIKSPYLTSELQTYPSISFSIKRKRYNFKWHHLVWRAFENTNIDFTDNKFVINHIDNNQLNNRLSNLELITRYDNTLHYINNFKTEEIGNINQSQSKNYTEEDFREMFDLYYNQGWTFDKLIKKYNHTRLPNILKGKTYKKRIPSDLLLLTKKFI